MIQKFSQYYIFVIVTIYYVWMQSLLTLKSFTGIKQTNVKYLYKQTWSIYTCIYTLLDLGDWLGLTWVTLHINKKIWYSKFCCCMKIIERGNISCCSCQLGKNGLNVILGSWNWESFIGQVLTWDQLPCVTPHELLHTPLRERKGDKMKIMICQTLLLQKFPKTVFSQCKKAYMN